MYPLLLLAGRASAPRTALEQVPAQRGGSWKLTSAFLGSVIAIPLMVASGFLSRQDLVSATYHPPIQTSSILARQMVTGVELEVGVLATTFRSVEVKGKADKKGKKKQG